MTFWEKKKESGEMPSYENVYENYIIQNHSLKEMEEIYDCSFNQVVKLVTVVYCIKKDSSLIMKNTQKGIENKYGVKNVSQLEEIKNKKRQTTYQHYGVEVPSKSSVVKDKIKNTNIEKYGTECVLGNKDIREKVKKTVLAKYGVENVFQQEKIKNKIINTNIKKYGVDCPIKLESFQKKSRETLYKNYGVKTPIESSIIKDKIKKTNIEKYGTEWTCQLPNCCLKGKESSPNIEFGKKLSKYGIEYQREFIIDNFRYDFIVGNYLIEIDPTYTHNSTNGIYNREPLAKDYHYKKTQLAKEHGYHCIHVFDWDDQDKIIKAFLVEKERIFGRDTEIKEVSKEEAKKFLINNHLQGYISDKIRIGLYYKNDLVSIITFGTPRYNKNYQYEILRYCSSKTVIGGSEKLFKYFVNKYNPSSVISYCDNSKFSGQVYENLGFVKKSCAISRHWFNIKSQKHITDNLLRAKGFDLLFNKSYGKGTSNEELMLGYGFVEVYDAGQKTYIKNF